MLRGAAPMLSHLSHSRHPYRGDCLVVDISLHVKHLAPRGSVGVKLRRLGGLCVLHQAHGPCTPPLSHPLWFLVLDSQRKRGVDLAILNGNQLFVFLSQKPSPYH